VIAFAEWKPDPLREDYTPQGIAMLGGVDVTLLSDPGDENDHPETDLDWLRWLRLQIARVKMATPEDNERAWQAAMARAWAMPVPLRVEFDPGPHHDPGDEDTSAELIYTRGVVLSMIIRGNG
jgi:hypothetical protein